MTGAKIVTIEHIYENLHQIDFALANHNQDFVRSIVRMAHVILAMSVYGVEDQHEHFDDKVGHILACTQNVQTLGLSASRGR